MQFFVFLRVISYISTPGHLRFHYIQSRRTTEYKISVNSPSVRPRICFPRHGSCVLPLQTGQQNGSHAATPQKNDFVKEGNVAVFWSDSGHGHIAHHYLAFFLPMSSLLTTRLTKSEQGWHSRGTSETATFSASRKHGSLRRRYAMRCSQRVSPRIAPTETNISLVRRVAGAYAS